MARETLVRVVCDKCRSDKDVQVRRVGDGSKLLRFELCVSCRAPLDELLDSRSDRPARRRMRTLTLAEIEAEAASKRLNEAG